MTRYAIFGIACGLMLLAMIRTAAAGECLSRPERFQLNSDTVYWRFSIAPGHECLQGLRGRTQLLDDIKLIAPSPAGDLTIAGPSFRYKAPSVSGPDQFKISIAGRDRGRQGLSTIIVEADVR